MFGLDNVQHTFFERLPLRTAVPRTAAVFNRIKCVVHKLSLISVVWVRGGYSAQNMEH